MDSPSYSQEERKYAGEARDFFEKEIGPYVESMDRKNQYPFDLLKKLAQRHYIGVRFPTQYGGAGAERICSMKRSSMRKPEPNPMPWPAPAAFLIT